MAEAYVTVDFRVPKGRMPEIEKILHSELDGMDEDEVMQVFATLGNEVLTLLREVDENGERPWVDDDLGEQLHPQDSYIDDDKVSIEYICTDSVMEAFAEFMKNLFEAAGFGEVNSSAESEHDDD